jgi:hypothetical protein
MKKNWAIISLLGLTLFAGCQDVMRFFEADDPSRNIRLQQTVSDLRASRDATTQKIAEVEAQVKLLPDSDPQKQQALNTLNKLNASAIKAQEVLDKLEVLAKNPTITNTALDPLAAMFGPWGIIALGGARLVFSEYDRIRKQRYVEQLVKSVDIAVPELTDSQKVKMASVQDLDLQKVVAAIKKEA